MKFCGAPMVLRALRLGVFLQAFHRTQLLQQFWGHALRKKQEQKSINYVGPCMVPIIQVSVRIYAMQSIPGTSLRDQTKEHTANSTLFTQSFIQFFDPIFLFLQSDLPRPTGYRYLAPILPRQGWSRRLPCQFKRVKSMQTFGMFFSIPALCQKYL